MTRLTVLRVLAFACCALIPLEELSAIPVLWLSHGVGVVLFVVFLWDSSMRGRVVRPPATYIMLVVFAGFASASVAWASDPDTSISRAVTLAQILVLCYILYCVVVRCGHGCVSNGFLCGNVFVAVLTLSNWWKGHTFHEDLQGLQFALLVPEDLRRYVASGLDPNYAAVSMAIAVVLIDPFASRRGNWARMGAIAFTFVFTGAIVVTDSRGGVLALVSGLAFLIWRSVRRLETRYVGVAVICLLLVIVGAAASSVKSDYSSLISNRTSFGTARFSVWESGLSVWNAYPLIGCGLGGLPFVTRITEMKALVAHNTFIDVLAELGVVGFVLFAGSLVFLAHGAVAAIKSYARAAVPTVAALVCLAVGSLSLTLLFWKPWAVVFALVLGCAPRRSPRFTSQGQLVASVGH